MMPFTIETLLAEIQPARRRLATRSFLAVGDDWYGVRAFLPAKEIRSEFVGSRSRVRFAEDECGNYFTLSKSDGRVWFWDHETGKSTMMATNLTSFLTALAKMPEVKLKPGQVKSVWIDPKFMKKMKDEGLM
jgi:hypothetical protein